MKKLLVVESPAKVPTITKFLGKDFLIVSTVGHIKDLPTKELGVSFDPENHLVLSYQTLANKQKVIDAIIAGARKCDTVYLAPDPDREGEIIAWHVFDEIKQHAPSVKSIYRIAFNEITKQAVTEAITSPREINNSLVAAQQARRVLDRWVGYQASPILWRKVARGLSAGRVQSVALKLICTREEALRAFVAEEYWTIDGAFSIDSHTISAELAKIGAKKAELATEKQVQNISPKIMQGIWTVGSVKDTTRSRKPLAPFTTSTLQQAGYNQLGFSVQYTMQIAQKLYEGIPLQDESPTALITYMRTDSTRIAESAITDVRTYIKKEFSASYLPGKAHVYAKKSASQDAHEAIRPIDIKIEPSMIKSYVDAKTYKLYELIWKRFVACQMSPAVYAQRQITFIDEERFTFRASGSVLTFDGYLAVYDEKDEEDAKQALPPDLTTGASVTLQSIKPKQHFTQPPARYTEATLVKELEKENIGRPSTYATIMKTIQARDYTHLDEKKRFVPTDLGMQVTRLLETYLTKIMDINFTAEMEENLDKIARGEIARDEVLHTFYKDFSQMIESFGQQKIDKTVETTQFGCGTAGCEGKLLVKIGKGGQFLGCSKFPECAYTANFSRTEKGEIQLLERTQKLLDEKCTACGKNLQERHGKFGAFVSCSGYPACKYVQQQKTVASCPGCEKGKLTKRFWKQGTFWGCENYPTCAFRIPSDIAEKPCPACQYPFMKKIKSKTDEPSEGRLACASPDCKHMITEQESDK